MMVIVSDFVLSWIWTSEFSGVCWSEKYSFPLVELVYGVVWLRGGELGWNSLERGGGDSMSDLSGERYRRIFDVWIVLILVWEVVCLSLGRGRR